MPPTRDGAHEMTAQFLTTLPAFIAANTAEATGESIGNAQMKDSNTRSQSQPTSRASSPTADFSTQKSPAVKAPEHNNRLGAIQELVVKNSLSPSPEGTKLPNNPVPRIIRISNCDPKRSARNLFDRWLWVDNTGLEDKLLKGKSNDPLANRLVIGDKIRCTPNFGHASLEFGVTLHEINDFTRGNLHFDLTGVLPLLERIESPACYKFERIRMGTAVKMRWDQPIWVKRNPKETHKLLMKVKADHEAGLTKLRKKGAENVEKFTKKMDGDALFKNVAEQFHSSSLGQFTNEYMREHGRCHVPPGLPNGGEDPAYRLLAQLPKLLESVSTGLHERPQTKRKRQQCPFAGCETFLTFHLVSPATHDDDDEWEQYMSSDNIRQHCKIADHAPFFFIPGKAESKDPSLYHVVQKILFDAHGRNVIPYQAFQSHLGGDSKAFCKALDAIKHHALGMIFAGKVKTILKNLNVVFQKDDPAKEHTRDAVLNIMAQLTAFPYKSFLPPVKSAETDGTATDDRKSHLFELYNLVNLFFARGLFFTDETNLESIPNSAYTPFVVDPRVLTPRNYCFKVKPSKKQKQQKVVPKQETLQGSI